MKKRCIALLSIGLLVIFILAGCTNQEPSGAGPSKKAKVIKLAHSHQGDFSSEIHMAAWVFQQWVNDHSDTLEVKIYPSNALGQERDVYEAMQIGGGASCMISGTAILNNFYPEISVLDLPFIWENYEHVHKILDGSVGTTLANSLDDHGFHVLAWMDSWGYRNVVTSSRQVKTMDDLAGLKIRTIQTPIYVETIRAMGANATPMAFGEVYTSLQTGVLDGFEHSASIVKANKFYEVADHIALTRHLFGPLVFVYSKPQWDKLTDAEKQVIQQAALMARDVQRALAPVREKESLDFLREKGMTINEVNMTPFKSKAMALQDELARKNNCTKLLEQIREAK